MASQVNTGSPAMTATDQYICLFFAPKGTTEIDCGKESSQNLGYAKEGFEGRFQKPCLKLDLTIFPILMFSWNFKLS